MRGNVAAAASCAAGYLIGSVPFGLIVGRTVGGLDVRDYGSGNMGTANVLRTIGAKAGALTFGLDAAKGALAAMALAEASAAKTASAAKLSVLSARADIADADAELALADVDEAEDLPAAFCDECRRPGPVPSDRVLHRQRLQLLGRQGVCVGGLPGLHVNPGNAFRVVGCSGANHRREPTLPA